MGSKTFTKREMGGTVDEDTLTQAIDADSDDLAAQVKALHATVAALLESQNKLGPRTGIPALDDERLENILMRVAQMSADAQERAANPSNKTHPGISVFSYPEGDRERPRPDLKCPMFWNGYDISKDTTTAEEMELLNLAEPGVFTFTRTDRTPEQMTITGDRDASGHLSRLLFAFPVDERRDSLPSQADLLRSAFKVKSAAQVELETLRAEVASLRAAGA